ncbi:DinB family protein [Pseudochryseolinea flava]|uniref:DinB family protein n=1 Tax=Pseudochryseolinea flava TaxID=2059302 RepID=A0A364Y7L4_9BACT|nr:DinB family protein [Pseudochryseolinea flava]RAW03061.1 DinB family protein [Pseudochryseolinea flava]
MNVHLHQACCHILNQLSSLVHQITAADFARPVESLSGSTIGQHLRHTLEFFLCFQQGYQQGLINYDKRAHDKLIESDKYLALAAIGRISSFIEGMHEKPLKLEAGYDVSKDVFVTIDTNATRELVYNIEHAVHHMAIIKIGVREIARYISLADDFGIAASTIRHKETVSTSAH